MADRYNPFGCGGGGEYPLDRPNPMTSFPGVNYKNTDFNHQLVQLVQNIYKNLSDTQRGASLVGYSEDMTVREVLDFLLRNSGIGPGNIIELLEGKVDKEPGKSLSDENFTTEEKIKLSELEALNWSINSW